MPTVAQSVDVVVHLALDADGRRRVREILAVTGRVEGDIIETAEIFATADGRLVRGGGFPADAERYERAGYDLAALLGAGRAAAVS